MRVSTLPSAGGLDVNELSHKLEKIPVSGGGEGEEPQEDAIDSSDTSSNAAVFGSENGACMSLYLCVFVR